MEKDAKSPPKIQSTVTVDSNEGGKIAGILIEQLNLNLQESIQEAMQLSLGEGKEAKTWDGRNPFRGLAAFEEDDAEFFFGRKTLVQQLLRRVANANFVTIIGPSGSGKSSIARAGLMHALREGELEKSRKWLYATMTPADNPVEQLAKAVGYATEKLETADAIRQEGVKDPARFQRRLDLHLKQDKERRFVLLVDQFEEIFTQTEKPELRADFINLLTTAPQTAGSRVKIILCLRSDFLTQCINDHHGLYTLMNQQLQLVGPMTPSDLAEAIVRPCAEVGAEFENALVYAIISDMVSQPDALPLLSFTLRNLFEREKESNATQIRLTRQKYEDIGGIKGALKQQASQVFENLNLEQQSLARSIFSRLINVQGRDFTRRTVTFAELVAADTTDQEVRLILESFAQEKARLLTFGTAERGHTSHDVITIAHEKLIDAWPWLNDLANRHHDAISLQNEIEKEAQEWEENKYDADYLYKSGKLLRYTETKLPFPLTSLADRFIKDSLQHQKEERKKEEELIQLRLEKAEREAAEQKERAEKAEKEAEEQRRRAIREQATIEAILEEETRIPEDDQTVGLINSSAVAIGEGAQAVGYVGLTVEDVADLVVSLRAEEQPKVWDGRNPYLGLSAFQESDAQFFFGRDGVVEDLLYRVQESTFITVAGPSGSGKSSVIQAGLFDALRMGRVEESKNWLLASLQPQHNPFEQLARAIERVTKSTDAGDSIWQDPSTLQQQIAMHLYDNKRQRFVLLIDQFEQIFTRTKDREKREAFINLLTTVAQTAENPVTVVLGLRSDYISNCAAFPHLRRLISQQLQLIGAMAPSDLTKAITLPALEVGAEIDPALVSQLIADMRGEPGALPLMSFALFDLFEQEKSARGKPMDLTLPEYLEIGGIEGALERHANWVFAELTFEQKLLARGIFSKLIEVGQGRADTRRVATLVELIPPGANGAETMAVVNTLANENARLLTVSDTNTEEDMYGQVTVTIAHEKLIDAWPWLRQLVDENREAIFLQNEIFSDAQAWREHGDEGFLYRGGRLLQVQERLEIFAPSLDAMSHEFIQASIERREYENQAREAQRQRELEQAQLLAEEQSSRAEAERKIRRAFIIVAVVIVAFIVALIALLS